ncbi:hypothetical protein HAX54_036189 [Datura stramonium]|uniref:Uncharacterized protein n=1 Tax=Datura stramonium TaxID=4076 RepID=A0ABS8SG50_DATST|nr:hypothetical protein [Datura stramonium]
MPSSMNFFDVKPVSLILRSFYRATGYRGIAATIDFLLQWDRRNGRSSTVTSIGEMLGLATMSLGRHNGWVVTGCKDKATKRSWPLHLRHHNPKVQTEAALQPPSFSRGPLFGLEGNKYHHQQQSLPPRTPIAEQKVLVGMIHKAPIVPLK